MIFVLFFRKREMFIERLYFLFSFGLLLCRTIAVSLFAARINDEGLKSLNYIPLIRSNAYSTEVWYLLEIYQPFAQCFPPSDRQISRTNTFRASGSHWKRIIQNYTRINFQC